MSCEWVRAVANNSLSKEVTGLGLSPPQEALHEAALAEDSEASAGTEE